MHVAEVLLLGQMQIKIEIWSCLLVDAHFMNVCRAALQLYSFRLTLTKDVTGFACFKRRNVVVWFSFECYVTLLRL